MKTKFTLTLLAFAAVSINLHAMTSGLPAPLPEFMDAAQTAKWTADQATATQATSASAPSTQFYTGKPFVADAGGYVFKYRTYNPEMSRWTSADPSGFPDGVNNFIYAKNEASYSLDNNGLATLVGGGTVSSFSLNFTNQAGANYIDIVINVVATNSGISTAAYGTDSIAGTSAPIAFGGMGGTPLTSTGNVTGGGEGPGGDAPVFTGLTGTGTAYNVAGVGFSLSAATTNSTDAAGNPLTNVNLTMTINGMYGVPSYSFSPLPPFVAVTWVATSMSAPSVLQFVYE
jgi:RHS repeat-associated protein